MRRIGLAVVAAALLVGVLPGPVAVAVVEPTPGVVPAQARSSEPASEPPAAPVVPAGTVVEADAFHRVVAQGDGTVEGEFFGAPVFFEEPGAGFVPVDLSLVASPDGAVVRPARGPEKLARLSTGVGAGRPSVVMGSSAGDIVVRQPEAVVARAGRVETGRVPRKPRPVPAGPGLSGPPVEVQPETVSPLDPEASVEPGSAPRPSVRVDGALLGGRDLITEPTLNGFKQSVVLNDRRGRAEYETEFTLPEGVSVREGGPGVELVDAAGLVLASFGGGMAFDAAMPVPAEVPVVTRLVGQGGGRATVVSGVDAAWARSAARVLPLTIDPYYSDFVQTHNASPNAPECGGASTYMPCDTYVNSDNYAGKYSTQSELRTGSPGGFQQGSTTVRNDTMSFIKFFTDNYGSDCFKYNVQSASLQVYAAAGSSAAEVFHVRMAMSSPTTQTSWTAQPGVSTIGAVVSPPMSGVGTMTFAVTSIVDRWFEGFSTNHGFRLSAGSGTPSADGFRKFYSGNSGYSVAPKLTARWDHEPPCYVQNLNATGGVESATVTWSEPYGRGGSAVTGYTVQTYRDGALVRSEAVAPQGPAGHAWTVGGLPAGSGYTFRVWASNIEGAGEARTSGVVTVAPRPNTAPDPPVLLSPSDGSRSGSFSTLQALFADADGDSGRVVFTLRRVNPDGSRTTVLTGDGTTVGSGGASSLSLSGTSLPPGVYDWYGQAVDGRGAAGNVSGLWQFRVSASPAAPSASSPDDGAIVPVATPELRVNAVTDEIGGAVSYRFQVSTGPGFDTVQADSSWQAGTSWSVPAGALTAGTGYFWRAWARDTIGGESARAFTRSFTVNSPPTAAAPLSPADGATVLTAVPELVVSSATDPQGQPVSYRFEVAVDSAFSSVLVSSGWQGETSFTVPPGQLSAGSRYFWRVQTGDGLTVTDSSFVRSFTVRANTAPVVTKAVSAAEGSLGQALTPASGTDPAAAAHAAGEAVRYTVTVANPNAGSLAVEPVTDLLPAGLLLSGPVLMGGQLCVGCLLSAAAVDGPTLMLPVPGGSIPAGETVSFTYTGVLTGSERDCLTGVVNTAVATTSLADGGLSGSDAASTTVCGGGLGIEPWWSYLSAAVGPQSEASVNVANGNLVVSATDSTAVQGRGRLGYVLRRTYNSQESTVATLPGSFGAGWLLNVGFSGDLAGTGLTPTGLVVPRLGQAAQTVTEPLAITLADRDGTRHTFTPRLGLPALDVTGLTGALRPAALGLPAGYGAMCLATAYDPPPGVQLGLWRYVAVQPTDSQNPCGRLSATAGQAADPQLVLGYTAVRPDRLRTEFAATGQLLSMIDGSGSELAYVYDGFGQDSGVVTGALRYVYEPRSADGQGNACTVSRDVLGAPSLTAGCRAFTFTYTGQDPLAVGQLSGDGPASTEVRDPAGRVTRYEFRKVDLPAGVQGPVMLLTAVVNPPQAGGGSDTVRYRYQGDPADGGGAVDCGGSAHQLCAVVDARGASTAVGYTRPTDGAVSALAGLGRVGSLTDRRGTVTTLDYPDRQSTVTVRGGQQQRAFLGIDAFGRAARVVDGAVGAVTDGQLPADYAALHDTALSWDSDTSGCAQPAGVRDNNLCRQVRQAGSGTPPEDTAWLYDPLGHVLRAAAESGAAAGSPTPAQLVTTYGYRSQHWSASGPAAQSAQLTAGAGGHTTSGTPAPAGTLFTVTDRVEQLSPRGNQAAPDEPVSRYRTLFTVDSDSAAAPNVPPAGEVCAGPASNTGLVCAVTVPHGPADNPEVAVTRYSYDTFGQRLSMRTPNAGPAGAPYLYSYAGRDRRDLSGTVSADGWLLGVTDPAGASVAFGHDAAGNTVRSWDRNAVGGRPVTDFPGTLSAPTSDRYTQTLYASGPVEQAVAVPWRWPVSQRSPLGDATARCVDVNGNPRLDRPARGSAGQPIGDCAAALADPGPFDLLYDTAAGGQAAPDDRTVSVLQPEQRAAGQQPSRVDYDLFGKPVTATDPRGVPTRTGYDLVNRPVTVSTVRASDVSELVGAADSDCKAGPDGISVCTSTAGYDGVDNVVRTVDADGAVGTAVYNGVHWKTDTFTEGDSATQPRDAGTTPPGSPQPPPTVLHTAVRHDADGNALTVCSPREFGTEPGAAGVCTASGAFSRHLVYDPAGRMLTETGYRGPGSPALTTGYRYDSSGNQVAVTDPNGHTTTSGFDVLDRPVSLTRPRTAGTGFATTMGYDRVGNRTAVIEALDDAGATRTDAFTYDAANRLVDSVVGAGSADPGVLAGLAASGESNVRTRQVYDADGRVVGSYSPRAFTASMSDPDERFLSWTDVDRNGRPVATYTPRHDSATGTAGAGDSQATECPVGVQPQVPAGGVGTYPPGVGVCVTRMGYDSADRVSTMTLPTAGGAMPGATSRQLSFGHTADGLRARVTGPSPTGSGTVETATGFDGSGRPVQLVLPSGADPTGEVSERTVTMAWTADGLLARRSDPGYLPAGGGPAVSHDTRFGYDPAGQQTRTIDALGQVASTTWTADGLTSSVTDTGGNTTRYDHDNVGNVLRVLDPSGVAADSTNPGGVATVFGYTADNLLASELRPPRGDATRLEFAWGYDGAGRKSTQTARTVTALAVGSPAETDPALRTQVAAGGTHTFGYSPADRLVSQTGRAGESIRTDYDPDGNALTVTDNTVDAAGRPSTLTSSYYLDGSLRDTGDGTFGTRYGYDGAGQLAVREHGPDSGAAGGAVPDRTVFGHNDAGARTTTASSATTPAGKAWTTGYDRAGRVVTEQAPNGQVSTHDYHPDDTLAVKRTVESGADGAGLVAEWAYSYDNLSRQLTQTHRGQAVNGAEADSDHRYRYDPAGRVVEFADGPGTTRLHTATFDANGNRTGYTTGGVGTQSTAFAADNTIVSSTDLDGSNPRSSTYTAFGALAADGCYRYGYDGFDRLTSTAGDPAVPRCAAAPTSRYAYDGLDRQRQRTDTLPDPAVSAVTDLHYDGLGRAVASELTGGPAGTSRLFTLDPSGASLSLTSRTTTPTDPAGTGGASTAYLTDDGTGTIATVTSDQPSSTATAFTTCTARFDPWGTPTTGTSSGGGGGSVESGTPTARASNPCGTNSTGQAAGNGNDRFYRGQRRDPTTGNYQLGSRTYDPSRTGFLTPDSHRDRTPTADLALGTDPLTLNRYNYVNGDPLNNTDPNGHRPECGDPTASGCQGKNSDPIARPHNSKTAMAAKQYQAKETKRQRTAQKKKDDRDNAYWLYGTPGPADHGEIAINSGVICDAYGCRIPGGESDAGGGVLPVWQFAAGFTPWLGDGLSAVACGKVDDKTSLEGVGTCAGIIPIVPSFGRYIDEAAEGASSVSRSLDELSQAGAQLDRNGLTFAGRALQKHANRPGNTSYPKVPGGDLNRAGQDILDDILTSPRTAQRSYVHPTFGPVREFLLPGRGARFDGSGRLIGFL